MTFRNGNAYVATVLGSDVYYDLAALSVNAPASEFKPLQVVSSSTLKVGDPVIAIGNPFGLTGSVTTGIDIAQIITPFTLRMDSTKTFCGSVDGTITYNAAERSGR